jgi:hypothetical protein
MSESLIRAQIKTIMESVTGIGAVHSRERHSKSLATFINAMTSGGIVNGWTIQRQAVEQRRVVLGIGSGYIERSHDFRIMGIYVLDDSADTAATFQVLIDAVLDKFIINPTLNGTATHSDPIQVNTIDDQDFGDQRYYVAEMVLIAVERTT